MTRPFVLLCKRTCIYMYVRPVGTKRRVRRVHFPTKENTETKKRNMAASSSTAAMSEQKREGAAAVSALSSGAVPRSVVPGAASAAPVAHAPPMIQQLLRPMTVNRTQALVNAMTKFSSSELAELLRALTNPERLADFLLLTMDRLPLASGARSSAASAGVGLSNVQLLDALVSGGDGSQLVRYLENVLLVQDRLTSISKGMVLAKLPTIEPLRARGMVGRPVVAMPEGKEEAKTESKGESKGSSPTGDCICEPKWSCPVCTYVNGNCTKYMCTMCRGPRPGAVAVPSRLSAGPRPHPATASAPITPGSLSSSSSAGTRAGGGTAAAAGQVLSATATPSSSPGPSITPPLSSQSRVRGDAFAAFDIHGDDDDENGRDYGDESSGDDEGRD